MPTAFIMDQELHMLQDAEAVQVVDHTLIFVIRVCPHARACGSSSDVCLIDHKKETSTP